jgi:Family of unknown function (DUF5906)
MKRHDDDLSYKAIPALAAYINRIGAEQVNFRTFMVKEYRGTYYVERVLIRLRPDGAIHCNKKEYDPTDEEREQIKGALMSAKFPQAIHARDLRKLDKNASSTYYEFYDRKDGLISFVQERPSGKKAYYPWTFFDDGKWRMMEPDKGLPFWKPKAKSSPIIMVHEGAKAASFIQAMVDGGRSDHPWFEELKMYEHWGLIGGALAPQRARYEELILESPNEVVYVCDNDFAGFSVLQEFSRHYGKSLKGILFDKRWKNGWDMADDMPSVLFTKSGRYKGPTLSSLMRPATRATEKIPDASNPKKIITVTRRDFREEWFHSVKPELFIHKDWPHVTHTMKEFNNWVRPFSDADDTARLLMADAAQKATVLKYDPDKSPGIYSASIEGRFINTHVPSEIKSEKGDAAPFIEFMEHLIPEDNDRIELLRWCATLIARPDVKMMYGVLLISEVQGVGKGTLGEKILAPLIGIHNVSYPSESEIVESNYNYWLAHRRLAVVHEIYAGHSAKAYNKLKSTITDRYITVSRKFIANYDVQNWIHIFACSNSMRAIKLSSDDRRWFVPKVTDEKKNGKYWTDLNYWLTEEGGLNIIKWWATDWLKKNNAVMAGDAAPSTKTKDDVIDEGYSAGQKFIHELLVGIKEEANGHALLIADTDLVKLVHDEIYQGRYSQYQEKPSTIRKIAKRLGFFINPTRAFVKKWGMNYIGPHLICTSEKDSKTTPGALSDDGRELFRVDKSSSRM